MYSKYVKKILDFVLALCLAICLSPLMILIAIFIKLDSKGPVLFKQIRSGKNNQEFELYKFRSMTCDNNFYNTSKEDQVTKVGKFLRKTSLDELPQLLNILKGEMSFIGPRPWVVDYAKYFTEEQMRRLEVLPGITGLAQCSGRNNLGIKERISIDIKYVDSISLKMDLLVIFKTIKCVLKKEGFSNTKSSIHNEILELKQQHEIINIEQKISKNKRRTPKNNKRTVNESILVGSGV